MIYAQIKNGLINNVIEANENTPLDLFSEGYDHLIRIDNLSPVPGINWSYDGNIFTAPIIPPAPIADVTPRQMRTALALYGVLGQVETTLASLPEPMKTLAGIEWDYSIAFERNRPLVAQVGAMLGWTNDQLDALWKFAAGL